ncbi:cadmium resistance transporter [Microcystis protocystis FBCC-A270]|jgi:cadmium resistance transport/sequestration family protein|uniref:cadmium resistance transporter n=1 Tax=Microcystis TaxID=1125 RepID=UPI00118EEEC4|nr:cadmium resistance transporter [Microcystis sp. Msp_OC_L_20101000_S702]TRU06973.1 MAG: transporter [Microcystis sp. Msp_OC_L_20101000_S702]
MNWLVALLITSVTSFVATNLDDLMVLMLFFSRLNANFRPRHLIIGQYLGFTLILLASSLGLLFGLLVSKEWIGLLGFIPLIIGIKQLLSRENEDYIQEVREDVNYSKNRSFFPRFPSQTYYVAAVTVANGGDNIGIYTSLFANNSPMHVLIIMIIFYLMMGIWCALAYFLITHPRIAKVVTNYGHKISPFIYIFLGIYILVDSQFYRLFLTY